MRTEPDGVEVVQSITDAEQLSSPPLLVVDSLTRYLDLRGIGDGPVSWSRVGDGQSNITYRIERDDAVVVLRRGPRPPHPPSTHDMVREATLQKVLGAEGVQVPTIIDVCEDPTVLGVPFYLMEWLDGEIVTDVTPASLDTPDGRREISTELVSALANLHSVDVTTGPVSTLGRPDGYLERQIRRFSQLWAHNTTRDVPAISTVADWLEKNRPTTQAASVVHGDFRLGNVMLACSAAPEVRAILDWELATLGDPLADLGYLTATYSDATSPDTPLHLSPATTADGYLNSDELVEVYAKHSSLDLSFLAWYQALALWKAAIFCEAIYSRWKAGERPGDTSFGPSLEAGVPALVEAADAFRRRL